MYSRLKIKLFFASYQVPELRQSTVLQACIQRHLGICVHLCKQKKTT